MKINPKGITDKFSGFGNWISNNVKFIFIIVILLMYGFLAFRIGVVSRQEPSDDQIVEKTRELTRLRVDPEAIEKMQTLEDQNIQIQTLFNDARSNPFTE